MLVGSTETKDDMGCNDGATSIGDMTCSRYLEGDNLKFTANYFFGPIKRKEQEGRCLARIQGAFQNGYALEAR